MVQSFQAGSEYRLFAMEKLNEFLAEWENAEDYIVAHTSGSTGKPKAIRLQKADMRASARATCRFFGIGKNSTIGMALSTSYIAGKMMTVRALESGARLVATDVAKDVDLSGIDGTIDLFAIVPAQIDSFIKHPEWVGKVRNLLIGGSAPAEESLHSLNLLGYTSWISYGMTETCSHVALAHGDDSRRIFHAMPDITFSTTDDGRLVINAPQFSFGTLVTNDVVELISPERFRWRGRADNVINSGGIKFLPEELEKLYTPFISGRFYVTNISDPVWGQAIALVVEKGDADTISIVLRDNIADHRRLPKKVFTLERLPEASNGKIRRISPDNPEYHEYEN